MIIANTINDIANSVYGGIISIQSVFFLFNSIDILFLDFPLLGASFVSLFQELNENNWEHR